MPLDGSYRDGVLPVTQSRVQAYKWYSLAMESDILYAADARDKVAEHMSADEVREAESLATEWLPNPAKCGTDVTLRRNAGLLETVVYRLRTEYRHDSNIRRSGIMRT